MRLAVTGPSGQKAPEDVLKGDMPGVYQSVTSGLPVNSTGTRILACKMLDLRIYDLSSFDTESGERGRKLLLFSPRRLDPRSLQGWIAITGWPAPTVRALGRVRGSKRGVLWVPDAPGVPKGTLCGFGSRGVGGDEDVVAGVGAHGFGEGRVDLYRCDTQLQLPGVEVLQPALGRLHRIGLHGVRASLGRGQHPSRWCSAGASPGLILQAAAVIFWLASVPSFLPRGVL